MEKPIVRLIGANGNVFNLSGLVRKALVKSGPPEQSKEFCNKAFNSDSYDAVLQLIMEYCEVV